MWENNNGSWNNGNERNGWVTGAGEAFAPKDESLQATLTRTFLFMAIALMVTGITAMIAVRSTAFIELFYGGYAPLIICVIAELVLVVVCQRAMLKDNVTLAAVLFAAFAIVNGLMFSSIFIVFEAQSIGLIFLMTAGIFGVLAAIGITTKRDLSKWGTILRVGIIALLVGSVINLFIGATRLDLILTMAGIIIFTFFTIYDINKVVRMIRSRAGLSMNSLALFGALELYLDFINLFIRLLRLFGRRRD